MGACANTIINAKRPQLIHIVIYKHAKRGFDIISTQLIPAIIEIKGNQSDKMIGQTVKTL